MDDADIPHAYSSGGGNGPPAIEALDLRKNFGATKALDGFSLTVAPGEVHGFLGPNGAGKSTVIRALLGQLRLSGGQCRIYGLHCWKESVAVHKRVAYVPGDVALWEGLSGGECIDVLMHMQGRGDPEMRDMLVERFALDPSKRTRTYSKGNRQKVALVAAFSSNADLYLLDEPTSGLDPLMEDAFQATVREAKERGAAVLLSSHILAEVEALCDRVTIIRGGRDVSSGTLEDLRGHATSRLVATTVRKPTGIRELAGVDDYTFEVQADGHRISFRIAPACLNGALERLTAAGVAGLTVVPPSLDELFLSVYEVPADTEYAG